MILSKSFEISRSRYLVISIFIALCVPLFAQTTDMETQYKALVERFPARDKQLPNDLKA